MTDHKKPDSTTATPNAVATFCAAAQTNDVDAMVAVLSPDVELLSPLIGRMIFRGTTDLPILLGAVFGCLRGLRRQEFIGDGQTRRASRSHPARARKPSGAGFGGRHA
jgi:hypothetical protein